MRFLILHGYEGSGEGHWQAWLAGRLRAAGHDVAFPELPDPFHPQLDAWLAALEPLRGPEDVVLCHSLACCLWLHHRARGGPPAQRVLLVAPPHPEPMLAEIASFFPVPLDPPLAGEARIVCSDADPYCPAGAVARFAEPLGCPYDLLAGAGHVNADAGFGPWPAAERWAHSAGSVSGRPKVAGRQGENQGIDT